MPPMMQAKKTSANFKKFVSKHGINAFELETLPPATLESILTQAIDDVIDVEKFNAELDAEKTDAAFLEALRRRAMSALAGIVE